MKPSQYVTQDGHDSLVLAVIGSLSGRSFLSAHCGGRRFWMRLRFFGDVHLMMSSVRQVTGE